MQEHTSVICIVAESRNKSKQSPELLGFVYLDYMKGLVRFILVLVFLACVSYGCRKDVEGCMDIKASNFNPHATLNDGSCNYDVTEKLG